MSRKVGKAKDWGSRTGRKKNTKIESSIRHQLASADLSDELLTRMLNGDSEIAAAAQGILSTREDIRSKVTEHSLVFKTKLGRLFRGDCISLLQSLEDNSLDCIFADPPFNLSKDYGSSVSDEFAADYYLEWTRTWLDLCVSKLKDGGSLFVYNIPKWSIHIAAHLEKKLSFKHWIAVDLTLSMPIPGRLFPSHYSLLYFIKGKSANTFTPSRVPTPTCPDCGKELKDYGGYKKKMHPEGINLRDIWTDIPPVRHSKYKNRDANELHIKLIDRVLDIATKPGDLVFDPFGGSGTTYAVAELKGRKWLGVELGDCDPIIQRMTDLDSERELFDKVQGQKNVLFTDESLRKRARHGHSLDAYNISEEQLKRALGSNYSLIRKQLKLDNLPDANA